MTEEFNAPNFIFGNNAALPTADKILGKRKDSELFQNSNGSFYPNKI